MKVNKIRQNAVFHDEAPKMGDEIPFLCMNVCLRRNDNRLGTTRNTAFSVKQKQAAYKPPVFCNIDDSGRFA